MEIKFAIPTDDLKIIHDNMDYFKKLFPRFEILSEAIVVEEDELDAEYKGGADMFDWTQVVFQLDNLNNFWYMAKMVQLIKIQSL